MTAAEAMQEMGEWLDPVGSLGCIWRDDGRWVLNGNWASMEAVECYLTGWLQKWYADNYEMVDDFIYGLASRISKQAENGKPMERGLVPMIDMYDDRGFLPALWAAYKDVEKIEVS